MEPVLGGPLHKHIRANPGGHLEASEKEGPQVCQEFPPIMPIIRPKKPSILVHGVCYVVAGIDGKGYCIVLVDGSLTNNKRWTLRGC